MTPIPTAQRLRLEVAEEIRAWMARRRISGVKLAEQIGRTQPYVSRRLNGEVAFDVDDLEHIAAALGITVRDLIPNTGPESITVRYPTPDGPARPSSRAKPATRSDVGRRSDNRRPRDVRPFGHPGMIPPPPIEPERWAA